MEKTFYLITGIMASGKSTTAEALARSMDKCVHVRGDIFRRMVVSGRADMCENAPPEAIAQLNLRYDLSAQTARAYFGAGFSVVLQDNYYCEALPAMLERLKGLPVRTVVLCPDVETVKNREALREKKGYTGFSVESLHKSFMEGTPRVGFWLDNSNLTENESVCKIRAHFGK